ncbi:MAG: hypothetical protein ACFB6S_19130 [Geminicoccaceae bacterium]
MRLGVARVRAAVLLGLADLVVAALFFTGLGLALILMIHAMNSVAAAPLFDLPGLFADLNDPGTRHNYWWLYLTIFSTLIPTLLHLWVSFFCLAALFPQRLKDWVVDRLILVERSNFAKIHAVSMLSVMATVSLAVPCILFGLVAWGLYQWYPQIGGRYLYIFENFATWLALTW